MPLRIRLSVKSSLKVSKCVGCGYCCMKTPCDAARRLYKGATECPQLEWSEKNDRYICGLMVIPGLLGQGYRQELYCGAGCCSNLNSWRKDVKQRSRAATEYNRPQIPTMFQAFLKAFAGEPMMGGDKIQLILASFQSNLYSLEYSEDEVQYIMRSVVHYVTSNKSSMFKGFMA